MAIFLFIKNVYNNILYVFKLIIKSRVEIMQTLLITEPFYFMPISLLIYASKGHLRNFSFIHTLKC